MLGKLIKYDLLADWKKYCVMYGATVFAAVALTVLRLISENDPNSNEYIELTRAILSAASLMLMSAVAAMTAVLLVIRFYKNLVRDEGYLMHTLPVPTWQLLASKLITSYIWLAGAVIVLLLCIAASMDEGFKWLLEYSFGRGSPATAAERRYMVMSIIRLIVTPAAILTHIYLSFALGNLSNKSKLGMAVAMYFVINIGKNIVTGFVMALLMIAAKGWNVSFSTMFGYLGDYGTVSLVFNIVFAVAFFIAAERIFAKKLNLE